MTRDDSEALRPTIVDHCPFLLSDGQGQRAFCGFMDTAEAEEEWFSLQHRHAVPTGCHRKRCFGPYESSGCGISDIWPVFP